MNKKEEIWKDIKDYENLYKISESGIVKSLERLSLSNRKLVEKILKPTIVGDGYLQVTLFKNGKRKSHLIHLLVADHFLEEKRNERLLVVDHNDNNKFNNHYLNLSVVTQRVNNSKDSISNSSFVGVCFEKSTGKFRSEIRINGKNKFLGRFTSELEASKAYQQQLKLINQSL